MNQTFLILTACMASAAVAQPLLSNASSDPSTPAISAATTSLSGVPAPAGLLYAETPGTTVDANAMAGFSLGSDVAGSQAYRLADDFTISGEFGVRLHSATLYAYVPGYTSTTQSPFSAASVRLWLGHPADPTSWLVFGDDAVNRLNRATPTSMLRIFNTRPLPHAQPPDAQRRIWAIELDLGDYTYESGTYWLDVQVTCADPAHQAWAVPVSIAGSRGGGGAPANAYALTPDGLAASWIPIFDPGKSFLSLPEPQDLAFIIEGEVLGAACPADFNRDGGVDGDDVTAFFSAWEAGESTADVNLDGGTDGSDITIFFDAWEAGGC